MEWACAFWPSEPLPSLLCYWTIGPRLGIRETSPQPPHLGLSAAPVGCALPRCCVAGGPVQAVNLVMVFEKLRNSTSRITRPNRDVAESKEQEVPGEKSFISPFLIDLSFKLTSFVL